VSKFTKAMMCIPKLLPSYTIGIIFGFVFGYTGLINSIRILCDKEPIYLFGNANISLIIIIFILLWSNIGWQTIMFFSPLSMIKREVIDLSVMDGTNFFVRLTKIYIPEMLSSIAINTMLSVVFSFGSFFSLIHALTKGGPGYLTTTIDYMLFSKAFTGFAGRGNVGALSTILFAFLILIEMGLFLTYRCVKKRNKYEEKEVY
jgi:ABC-type sugar transport system permease subunit